jgi:hypothetical protein
MKTNTHVSIHGGCKARQTLSLFSLKVLTMVKIKINIQNTVELLSQFVSSKDYVVDVTESFSLISSQTNCKLQSVSVLLTYN